MSNSATRALTWPPPTRTGDGEMSDHAQERALDRAVERALSEAAGSERYQRHQRMLRSGIPRATHGPRPREFDESGFPVPQRSRRFAQRVAQLLSPG
jgi:hypothetical protein